MLINKESVMKFLPHRDPFLFVDGVEKVIHTKELAAGEILSAKDVVGSKVVAHYRTLKDHAIFAGHFPGNPILPGVVQVEMMAQCSSFILIDCIDRNAEYNMDVALVSIASAKFRKPIVPEMDLVIETECTKSRGPMIENSCKIFHNGELMSEAVVLASVRFK
ncbi:putative beta-hydroxyacyl-(acyl-carrier-protein) dehydratase FabZ [Bacteriovorax sp. BSW11_IV]|uniref:3-hydroxyacyl-ACP dehydratase FabZ family protein n=1 Tax=Bacteriovorax sp. BSW11_IV TaxID=1353529 RepID=UPI00038A492D|nr:3-hydroxyacyl-ACP dehydratase FabZ family protein [Bacteriovorax sp. BSW11_IV]EQC48957.1 putative beta-hydroxyacyl-(acyl-carrier-protein) dehydratase FabZ [Bacteriovorax sp. BSW11_IV]